MSFREHCVDDQDIELLSGQLAPPTRGLRALAHALLDVLGGYTCGSPYGIMDIMVVPVGRRIASWISWLYLWVAV